jgi:hypothetical protein
VRVTCVRVCVCFLFSEEDEEEEEEEEEDEEEEERQQCCPLCINQSIRLKYYDYY